MNTPIRSDWCPTSWGQSTGACGTIGSTTIVRRSASHAVLDALRPVFSAGTVQSCKTTSASLSIASCRSA
ncbi:hypothetical protein CXB35_26470 [Pseudomonas syringae]|nr:hypothetical protein CXB35_26470 [Pseudomonas syringae]